MKKLISAGLISCSMLSITTGNAAETTSVNGGSVHFKGEVVNAACAVNAGSVDQTIILGQVRTARLSAAGNFSSPVGFNIQLDDCDVSVASKASIAFSGVTVDDSANSKVLALQNSGSGGATNVGIQIIDSNGSPLSLDGSTYSSAKNLINGTNVLPFQARYYATGKATAGTANADATFKVEYQ